MVQDTPTDPILPTNAVALEPANAPTGPTLVGENVAATGERSWRGAAKTWSGLVVSLAVHLLFVLWLVGLFVMAEKLPDDDVYPVTLVSEETIPPPQPPESVLEQVEASELPEPSADSAPQSPATAPEAASPDQVPEPGEQQFDEFSETLAAFGVAAFDRPTSLTKDELGALKAQAIRCWKAPSGWTDPRQVSVTVRFLLNRDGTVKGTPAVVEFPASILGKAAADDAIRAVLQCGPYEMPADKYEQWNDVQLSFEP